jgi:hypothetical protein
LAYPLHGNLLNVVSRLLVSIDSRFHLLLLQLSILTRYISISSLLLLAISSHRQFALKMLTRCTQRYAICLVQSGFPEHVILQLKYDALKCWRDDPGKIVFMKRADYSARTTPPQKVSTVLSKTPAYLLTLARLRTWKMRNQLKLGYLY